MRNTTIASACVGFGLAAPNDDGKLTDTGQKIEVGGAAAAIRSSTDR